MITSSNFFQKSFFTVEQVDERLHNEELSPWNLSIQQGKSEAENRGKNHSGIHEMSRISSKKYIEKKLRANSIINSRNNIPTLKQRSKFFSISEQQSSKNKPQRYQSISYETNLTKKKSTIFPQLNVNQYRKLIAQGTNMNSSGQNSFESILAKKKSKKRLFQETIKHKKQVQDREKVHNKKVESHLKPIVSSQYVCAVKKPNFNLVGLRTNKFVDLL